MSAEAKSMEDRIAASMGFSGVAEAAAQEEEPAPEDVPRETSDFAEIDWNGSKYQIPTALKDAFMQNADYTQKTQSLAEERRSLEQLREIAQTGALDREFQASIGQESQELSVIDAYLSQVKNTDWANMTTDQMLRHKVEVDNIKERRQALKDAIETKRQAFNTNFTTKLSELRAKTKEIASKSIPGLTEETEKSLREFAKTEGFSDREIDNVLLDPRSFKTVWKAMQYEKVVKTTGAATKAVERVIKPGAASERIPAKSQADINFRKAMGAAKDSGSKARVIESRLEGMFAKR